MFRFTGNAVCKQSFTLKYVRIRSSPGDSTSWESSVIWMANCTLFGRPPQQGRKRLYMDSIAWWPTLIVLAVATFTDLRSRRIPNWLVFPFMLAGIGVSGWLHGWSGIGQSLAGLGLGALLLGLLCWLGGMGMGDLKLCAAIGAWIGPMQLMFALVITSMAGGVMALCWAAAGGFLGELFQGAGDLVFGFTKRGLRSHPELVLSNPSSRKMPYAPAIAVGTIVSFFSK
jgi:prepilin peptidase CpaA